MWDITEAEGKLLGCSIKTLSEADLGSSRQGYYSRQYPPAAHYTFCPSKVLSK